MDLPPVGLGTMGVDDPSVVAAALDVGYTHIDTAQIYDNEAVVGDGLAGGDLEDCVVATKLWTDSLAADAVRAGTERSLDRLGLDAVDLLYVHRPRGDYDPATTLPALERVRATGLTDGIGLSNFTLDQVRTADEYVDDIAAHQVEFHPFFRDEALLGHAQREDYPLVAYSPLAGGLVFEDPTIQAIAQRHETTPAAVAIAWATSYDNVVTIPKASSRAHLEANLEATRLELAAGDIDAIEAIDREEELFPE
ncbi:aldo/keto reductase [Haloarcula salinisoli]|uniref:Aldo/keto reductase n=1 Tax=Haloarcula salinisoli TaxID=2487746 RepID=A0A8J7YA76_9EURY|nr:aldo/keto reductase [Halomicroarcula salinisoli]MBX0302310.1 aldo/keto reductase [Halomicroarcula salinisoli]